MSWIAIPQGDGEHRHGIVIAIGMPMMALLVAYADSGHPLTIHRGWGDISIPADAKVTHARFNEETEEFQVLLEHPNLPPFAPGAQPHRDTLQIRTA